MGLGWCQCTLQSLVESSVMVAGRSPVGSQVVLRTVVPTLYWWGLYSKERL
jgi:hypothetical protein